MPSPKVTQICTRFNGGWELLMTASRTPDWPGEMNVALKWPHGIVQYGPSATFEDASVWATGQIESFQEWHDRGDDLLD